MKKEYDLFQIVDEIGVVCSKKALNQCQLTKSIKVYDGATYILGAV